MVSGLVVEEGGEVGGPFEEGVVGVELTAHSARLRWGDVAGV